MSLLEKPTKCINSRKLVDINAQVQFIDFEGRSDGESLLKILSQLRPRRVVVVRGTPENIDLVAKHCAQSIGARVFTPQKGDIVDATTETHIYQVKLTEALVTQLQFQKGKDAEVAWIDAQLAVRNKKITPAIGRTEDAPSVPISVNINEKGTSNGNNGTSMDVDVDDDDNEDELVGTGTFLLIAYLFIIIYRFFFFQLTPQKY